MFNKMMFCPNSSSQMNPTNEALIRMNGWSQVVPICMPWATPTPTPTTSPIISPIYSGIDVNKNVMQFTANTQPFNLSMSPSMMASMNPYVYPSVIPSVIPISQRDMDEGIAIKNQIVCPDPCTSQTATHWELLNNISRGNQSSHKHLKRRNDSSDEEIEEELRTPIKQHISEDKVSAIFNRLQITNNDSIDFNDKIECEEFEDQTNETKIVFADELQTAIKGKTITDRLVQNELDKHSKAVVLWQPITPLYTTIGPNTDSNEEDSPNDQNDVNCNDSQNSSNDLDIDVIDCNDFDNDMELCL